MLGAASSNAARGQEVYIRLILRANELRRMKRKAEARELEDRVREILARYPDAARQHAVDLRELRKERR